MKQDFRDAGNMKQDKIVLSASVMDFWWSFENFGRVQLFFCMKTDEINFYLYGTKIDFNCLPYFLRNQQILITWGFSVEVVKSSVIRVEI